MQIEAIIETASVFDGTAEDIKRILILEGIRKSFKPKPAESESGD